MSNLSQPQLLNSRISQLQNEACNRSSSHESNINSDSSTHSTLSGGITKKKYKKKTKQGNETRVY